MDREDLNSTRRGGLWATLAIAAVTSAVTIALPATSHADPEPVPPAPATTAAPAPAPGDPNA
ncbi:hypothetical protein FPZ47_02395, partial [Mycobacterium helveticum]